MGWIVALVTIPVLVMLGVILWRLEGDKGWRDQAEGLRERLEHEGLPPLNARIARAVLNAADVEFTNGGVGRR
jgi:hypothetical protein